MKRLMSILSYWSGKMGANWIQHKQVKRIHVRDYKITWTEANLKCHFLRYVLRVRSINQMKISRRLGTVLEKYGHDSLKHKSNSRKEADTPRVDLTFQEQSI